MIANSFTIDTALIIDYMTYQLNNEMVADIFREKVLETIKSLTSFPLRFAIVKDDIRKVSVKKFNIFYSVDELLKIVNILHILYQGRDITQIINW